MPRKTSRRSTNYSNQNDEQQGSGQQQQHQQYQQQSNEWQQPQVHSQSQPQNLGSHENKDNDNDSLIADMAQGFIQAQAAMTDQAMNFNNREIGLLLQKVNDQLEELKRSTPNSGQTGEQSSRASTTQDSKQQNKAGETMQNNTKQQADSGPSTELQGLLATVLQGKKSNEDRTNQSSNTKNNDVSKGKDGKSTPNMTAVQTVSQVLAQAQYELANELETSLKKLKQVISESEKLANEMSNLLGEETMKNS